MTKYAALVDEFRGNIQRGVWKPGDKLKTEVELSREFGVSRQTIRQALSILSADGVIERIQGSGTYISRERGARPTAPEKDREPSRIIGLVTSFMDYYIFPQFLGAIKDTLSREGYYILLGETKNRVSVEREVLKDMLDQPLSGMIVECSDPTHPNPNADLYARFREKGVPVLFINGEYTNVPDSVSVRVNDSAGSYWLTRKLIREGCKTFGGVFKSDPHGGDRYYGCIKAMLDADLAVDESAFLWFSAIEADDFMKMYAAHHGMDLLAQKDALVCYNDLTAISLIELFHQCGYDHIPRIACFDNTGRLNGADVSALTFPSEALGQCATRKLLAMLKGEPVESEILPWTEMAN